MAAGGGGMGRLVGVGFLVGAKDDGATETFDDTAESADRLAEAAERAGEGSRDVGLLRRAIEGLTTINVANISDSLASLAERAGTGIGAQSTSLESFGAQFGQTARAAEARLGSMSGALRAHRGEVSSLAYTYGISGDEMFAAMSPLARIGVDIEETGINVRALAGHLQAGMISGQAFGGVLAELIGTYEMEADAAGTLVNSLTAIGDRFGMVAEVGQGLPAIMDAIRPVAARYPNIAEDVDGVAVSITRLAAGMTNMGMAPEQAMQAAISTFNSLGEQRDALEGMVTGLGTEFPELAQQIGISTGDIEGSIAAVMSSPVEFAQRMGEAMRQAGEDSVFGRRLAASLRDISPELLNVVRNAAQGGDALAQAVEPIEGVEDAFNRAGRSALTSTLTFSEQLDRMRDAFQTRMNSIGRRIMPDFMSRQRAAYREVGDRIERWASDDGPLGTLTRGFLRVRTFGLVQGLLPQLGALGVDLGETAQMAGPLLLAMNQLGSMRSVSAVLGRVSGALRLVGGRALMVLGPIGIIAGAGLLLYQYWDRIPGMFDRIGGALESAGQWFRGIGQMFADWVGSFDWAEVGRNAVDSLFSAITTTIEALFAGDRGGGQVGSAIWDGLVDIFTGIGVMVSGLASGIMDRLREGFTNELGGSAGIVQRIFGVYFRGIYMNFRNLWTILSTIGSILITPWRAWWRVVQPIGAMVLRIFSDGEGEAEGFGNVMDWIVGVMENLQGQMLRNLDRFESMAQTVTTWWTNLYNDALEPVITALQRDLPYIEEQFAKIWSDLQTVFADTFVAIGEVGGVMWELWTDTLSPVFELFWGLLSQIFGRGNQSMSGKAEYSFREVGTSAREMWTRRIRPMLIGMVRGFAEGFNWILVNGTNLFTQLAVRGGTAMLRIQAGIERIRIVWEGMQRMMRAGWDTIESTTRAIIGNTIDFVDLTFQRMLHGWDRAIMDIKIALVSSFRSVLTAIQTLVDRIPAGIRQHVPALRDFGTWMTNAQENMREEEQRLGRERTAMLQTHRREERELQEQIDERTRRMMEAAQRTRDEYARTSDRLASSHRREESAVRSLTDFYTNLQREITEGSERAYRRTLDIARRLESGEITVERRQRARATRIRQAGALGERLEGIEGLERRIGAANMRVLEQAIAARAGGEEAALSDRDIANVVARLGSIRGRGRTAAVAEIAQAIESGRPIARGRPTEERSGGGRVARASRRRGAGDGGGGGPDADEIRDAVREGAREGTRDGVGDAARGVRVPTPAPGQPEMRNPTGAL